MRTIVLVLLCAACVPQTPAQDAAEASYGAALLRCVDAAKTLAESKGCRAKIDAEWGISRTGGGTP